MVNIGKTTSEYKLAFLAIVSGLLMALAGVALLILRAFGYGAPLPGYICVISGSWLIAATTVLYGRWRTALKKETVKAIASSPKRV